VQVIIEHDADCPRSVGGIAECYGQVVRLVNDPRATQGTSDARRDVLTEILVLLQGQQCTCGADLEIARRREAVSYAEPRPAPRG
jgi:hypothetical protein